MLVTPIEGHSIWAPFYDSEQNPLVALERRTLIDVLGNEAPSRVIDVACGTGYWLRHFQGLGSNVIGIDLCEQMLTETVRSPSLRGRVALTDATALPFSAASADLITCCLSLGYFRDVKSIFSEFARVLKPTGRVAITDLHPDAAAAGWTRSFKIGHERYEMAHFVRSLSAIAQTAVRVNLHLGTVRAIHFGEPEYEVFRRADKERFFAEACRIPALFLAIWEKAC
jgi:ubiquinone/menaquinone biosynthesis C-methylase UbiE